MVERRVEIDAVTVLPRTSYQNYPYARIAVDLNKDELLAVYVGVYDETGALASYCNSPIHPVRPL